MYKTLSFFLGIVLQTSFVFAGGLKGKITDAVTGEELTGATVVIEALNKGTISGLDGTYLLKDIPEGNYLIQCSFISYTTIKQSISVIANETLTLNFRLTPVRTEIEQVIISASGAKGSEIGAKMSEQKALQPINVVSAKSIEISPDLNMAGVVQRMSGIIIDKSSSTTGQYALLRGMDKRYNYTLVNGIKIPSTHNKHRYVSLDLFPADMVERVEVTKALTADMESDAIGGAVNLVMKSAPEKLFFQTNFSAGFSQFFADKSFIAFNSHVLNANSPYERNEKGYLAKAEDFNTQNLVLIHRNNPMNYTGNITIGNRFFHKKLGWIFSGSFQRLHSGENSLYFSDDLSRDGNNLPILKDMQERVYFEQKQNIGIHNKIDFQLGGKNQIKLYTAYILLRKNQTREVEKTDLMVSYDPDAGDLIRTHSTRLRFNSQSLLNLTLQGDHKILNDFSLNWNAVYSHAANRTPEEATITYGNSLDHFNVVNQYVDFDGSTRIWRRNSDIDKAAYINLIYTPSDFLSNTTFRAGGMYREKERTSFYNKYTLNAIVTVVEPDTSYISFFSEKGVNWNSYDEIEWQVYNPRGTIAVGENYNASEVVYAGYAMATAEINKFLLTGGFRLEKTTQGYYMQYPIGEPEPEGSQTYIDVLPSFHLKYSPVSRQNIRISYYRAINKPGFQEIVPYVDASEEPTSAGNKNLKHATADNIDLRFEHFPDGLDQYMVGLFYKSIKNPIEFAFDKFMNVSQNVVFMPINSDKAINYGIEVDVVKYFREWGIRANYTRTQSSITTNKLSRVKDANGNDSTAYVAQTRPLYGQSANVANISLLYKSTNNGFTGQLAFSYTGDRIYTVSRFINNDLWQKGFWQLDVSGDKNFRNGVSIYIKANNLLNTHTRVFIKKTNPINADVPFHTLNDKSTLVRDEYTMPAYLIGVRYKF